jgi:hypothetical protein
MENSRFRDYNFGPIPRMRGYALKILAITPHNAGCERVFSVLGWFTNQRRTR